MKDRIAVIDCPVCGGGIGITREQLMKWNDDTWFPLCHHPRPQKPLNNCATSIHFQDLKKGELVKLLRMIATPLPDSTEDEEDSYKKKKPPTDKEDE